MRSKNGGRDPDIQSPIESHGESVVRYCRRMLGDCADVDDVAQTVFVQALQNRSRLPEIHNLRAWLLGIARHRCLDHLKLLRHGSRVLDRVDPEDRTIAVEECPDLPAVDSDPFLQKVLDECLDGLDGRSRVVLVMRFCSELTYQEISSLTSDTEGALRVRVARALPGLRRCLEKRGVVL